MTYDQTQADKEEESVTITVKPHRITLTNVFIMCPFKNCNKEHVHGTARGNYAGHRASHCLGNNSGYYIENVVDFEEVRRLIFEENKEAWVLQ